MIRLHLVEDHPIIFDGLKQRFRHREDSISVVGYSENVISFIAGVSPGSFDIIILDLWMPGTTPAENLQAIKTAFPGKPVIVFTQDDSAYWMKIMMNTGASAYLLKNATKNELKNTIEKVYQGKTVFPPLTLSGQESSQAAGHVWESYSLQPTEKFIVRELANGSTLKDIATDAKLSVSSVEKSLKKIRDKFGVNTNPELIRVLIEQKLI